MTIANRPRHRLTEADAVVRYLSIADTPRDAIAAELTAELAAYSPHYPNLQPRASRRRLDRHREGLGPGALHRTHERKAVMTRHPAHALATFLVALTLLLIVGQLISDAAAELRPAATAMEGE